MIERTAEGAGSAQSMEDAVDADRLLGALPDAQRSVLVLRYYCDRTEAEVAEILECPIGTVKSRTHEAIARLADLVRAEPSAGAATRAGSTPAPPAGATSTHGGTPAREKRS